MHGSITDGVFIKYVDSFNHMLKRPPGWAIDVADYQVCKQEGVYSITLIDKKRKQMWRISISDFERKKFDVNRGFGSQYAVVLGAWEYTDYSTVILEGE